MARRARESDIHEIAAALPGVEVSEGDLPVYEVSTKSFVFHRSPRPDAVDEQGERLTDVVVIWVESEAAKQAYLADESLPLFTTPHFNGHRSVLLRLSRIGEMSRDDLAELIENAWLARAPKRMAKHWLEQHPTRS